MPTTGATKCSLLEMGRADLLFIKSKKQWKCAEELNNFKIIAPEQYDMKGGSGRTSQSQSIRFGLMRLQEVRSSTLAHVQGTPFPDLGSTAFVLVGRISTLEFINDSSWAYTAFGAVSTGECGCQNIEDWEISPHWKFIVHGMVMKNRKFN
jgi:hypothetical protein